MALYEAVFLYGTLVAETILASVHVRAHQQAGHMDASDLIKALQITLRGGDRPHMENEAVLDRMQERLAKRPEVLNQRRETVEHPFGSIKQWMNQGAFLMRGLEKVRGEFSLTALAYNLRRVLNLVGFAQLMTAVRT